MMEGLAARGRRAGEAAAARAAATLAQRLGEAMPQAHVVQDEAGVTISGRGVRDDPALRWVGGMLR